MGDTDNLSAGVYYVEVIDFNNCVTGVEFTIDQPELLELSASTIDVSCNGGNDGFADLTITGGIEPYTIMGDTNNLSAGVYYVEVVDSNNCVTGIEFTIDQPELLEVSASTIDVSCNGGNDGFAD